MQTLLWPTYQVAIRVEPGCRFRCGCTEHALGWDVSPHPVLHAERFELVELEQVRVPFGLCWCLYDGGEATV